MVQASEAAPAPRGRRLALALVSLVAVGVAVRPWIFAFDFALDDYAQLGMMAGVYPVERSPLDLFTFSDGSAEESRILRDRGFYPWFAHPRLELSMLRPLASALMWVDHGLFGLWAPGYHVHSLLWWVAMVAALLWLLVRLVPPRLAFLAALLFVVDEAHGVMLGWIANRNAIVSSVGSLVALGAYVSRREQGARPPPWLVLGAFGLALLGGEYALCFVAYFLTYELVAARDGPGVRGRALLLVVAPSLVYMGVRTLGGYGSFGSGFYVNPIREPGEFLAGALPRYATMASDLMLGLRAEWWTFGLPWAYEMFQRGLVDADFVLAPDEWRAYQEALGAAGLVLFAGLGHLAARWAPPQEARHLRWIAAGAVLSMVPLLASFPASRSLVAPLVGWSAVIGAFAYHGMRRGGVARVLGAAVLAFHLVIPALHTWTETHQMAQTSNLARDVILDPAVDEARLPHQRVVLMANVGASTATYVSLIRGVFGETMPRSVWLLNPTSFTSTLTRDGPGRLFVELQHGTMLRGAYATMFRTPALPTKRFQRFELDGLSIMLLEMRDGGPYKVRFDFDPPVDDPSWLFLHSTPHGLERFPMPPVGATVQVPTPVPYVLFQRR